MDILKFTSLFDSHCHLNDNAFDKDCAEVVGVARESGVEKIVDVGINLPSSKKAVENAKRFPDVVAASVGIDPDVFIPGSEIFGSLSDGDVEKSMAELESLVLVDREHVVMIGETGIDNYWLTKKVESGEITLAEKEEGLKKQEVLFRAHLQLADELGLPLTVHSRAAEEKCLEVLNSFPAARGIFHSYTGSYEVAKKVLDKGWGLGVNAIVTYKSAEELRQMYRKILGKIPSDWQPTDFYQKGIYFETDSPYLPLGGGRNAPNSAREIFEQFHRIIR